jgi:predicted DNA binding protein
MYDLSSGFPDGEFRLLAAMPTGEGVGSATLFAAGVDFPAVVDAMRTADAVRSAAPLDANDHAGVIQFETTEPFLQAPVREAGIPFEPPLRIQDGVATLTVTTTDESLSTLGDALRERGYGFEVEAVYDTVESGGPLTERQAEVLEAAVEHGYYESPRGIELNELAEVLGVRKSTLSVTLRRAEGRLARRFVENRDTISRLSEPE